MSSSARQGQRNRNRDDRRRARRSGSITASGSDGVDLKSTFQPLAITEVEQVHRAALDVLAETGMANATPAICELALSKGCELRDDGRLLFPRALVEDALAQAAREFVVHGRHPEFDFMARSGHVNFCTGGAAVSMLDIDERRYRPSTLNDLYDLSRLCDTLTNLQWFTRPVVATDIEDLYELDVNTIYASAVGTRKHIATSFTQGEHVRRLLPMLDALAGPGTSFAERPFCTVHATMVVSPLAFAADSLDVACAAVEIGMPVHCQTGPQAGATAPAALAGALVQGCAESLSNVVLINLLSPGHPVVLGNWMMVSDLRTGAFSGGGGEQALLGAASGQMSRFYGIPGGMGAGMTDSKLPDNQAGFEKALTMVLATLSGGGFVFESAGMLASLLGCSFEAMLIDDDMLSSVKRIGRGIEVNDETLSVAVVEEAVTGAGHFLGHSQTMALMESEYTYPKHADRLTPADWEEAGARGTWDRATRRARQVLDTHRPCYIDHSIDRRIRDNFPIRLAAMSSAPASS